MSWRQEKGEKWDDVKGATSRARFHDLVHHNRAHGVLAYVDSEPVGWCAFDRRVEFVKLHRAPSFACDDGEQVWSLPCFFIKAGLRGQGVSGALLAAALVELQARGAVVVEGYPVQPNANGKPTPAAFAWTGTRSLFAKAGFVPVGKTDGGKQRMRKVLA
jgi:GNAT superfamily N-acetyltransferase